MATAGGMQRDGQRALKLPAIGEQGVLAALMERHMPGHYYESDRGVAEYLFHYGLTDGMPPAWVFIGRYTEFFSGALRFGMYSRIAG